MALPTAYDADQLAQFAITTLGDLATALAWEPESSVTQEAVNDALIGYFGGAGLIADATDVPKLRAFARISIWRAVASATAGYYRFGADQMSFDRQQVHEHALAMIAEAEREAGAVGAGASLVIASVVRDSSSDPYSVHEDQWGVVA